MSSQLLTIKPDGGIVALRGHRGLFNPARLGKASIHRSTEILWDEERQAWYIKLLRGLWKGCHLSRGMLSEVTGENPELLMSTATIYFQDYEDAVTVEIHAIESARKRGLSHLVGDEFPCPRGEGCE